MEEYPPITKRMKGQIKFMKKCMELDLSIEEYFKERDKKYESIEE